MSRDLLWRRNGGFIDSPQRMLRRDDSAVDKCGQKSGMNPAPEFDSVLFSPHPTDQRGGGSFSPMARRHSQGKPFPASSRCEYRMGGVRAAKVGLCRCATSKLNV